MSSESQTPEKDLAGTASGRFCPKCRSAMVFTGALRHTEAGPSAEGRCSACGFTAWKRHVFPKSVPERNEPQG